MAFLKLNGIDVFYELQGKGFPIFFLPDFASTHHSWRYFLDRFAKTHQTLIMDHRGSGLTDCPAPPYSIEMMAEDALTLMEILGIEQVDIIASSMGAAIAQTLILRNPERVRKGVFISSFAKFPLTAILKFSVLAKLLEAKTPSSLVVKSMLPFLYGSTFLSSLQEPKENMESDLDLAYVQDPEGYLGQLSALKHFDLQDQVSDILIPLLLIAGEQDLLTPIYCSHFLHHKISSSRLKIFPDVGHWPHIEKKEKTFNLIHAFIETNLKTPSLG